jgi:hypothetical protein
VTVPTHYPLPYGLARLQARVGDLPTAAEWTRLRAAEGFGPFLDAARRGPLRAWLTSLDTHSGSHAIERQLRHSLGWQIEELTQWLPGEWHPALRWLGLLPYLGIFAYLGQDSEVYPWMREDMVLFPYLKPGPDTGRRPDERLASEALPGTWVAGWYRRLPRGIWRERRFREKFGASLLMAAGLGDDRDGDDGGQLQQLHSLLLRLFHRHCATPLAAFAYLGLILLQTRWLRAELQRRLLFPAQGMVS